MVGWLPATFLVLFLILIIGWILCSPPHLLALCFPGFGVFGGYLVLCGFCVCYFYIKILCFSILPVSLCICAMDSPFLWCGHNLLQPGIARQDAFLPVQKPFHQEQMECSFQVCCSWKMVRDALFTLLHHFLASTAQSIEFYTCGFDARGISPEGEYQSRTDFIWIPDHWLGTRQTTQGRNFICCRHSNHCCFICNLNCCGA